MRVATGLALGALLGAAPFLRYAPWSGHGTPHANHAPRHGGELRMLGEHHVELVARGDRIELYTSDAVRRPVTPRAGSIAFDGAPAVPLAFAGQRLVGDRPPGARDLRTRVELDDGTVLAARFVLAE